MLMKLTDADHRTVQFTIRPVWEHIDKLLAAELHATYEMLGECADEVFTKRLQGRVALLKELRQLPHEVARALEPKPQKALPSGDNPF